MPDPSLAAPAEERVPTFFEVLRADDSAPMDPIARELWVKDLENPLRVRVLPVMRLVGSLQLHAVYFLKRLLPFQFSAHRLLQGIINFFMERFVTPEANYLILRHQSLESNLVNFVIANSRNREAPRPRLYPETIADLAEHTFVKHDQALFRAVVALGPTRDESWPVPREKLDFSFMRPTHPAYDYKKRRWTQFIDFETAHELFKVTFCLLLTAREYEAAINSLQFDQALGMRIERIIGEAGFAAMSFNQDPMILHSGRNLSKRFASHGLWVEQMHARVVEVMASLDKTWELDRAGAPVSRG